MNFLFCSVGRRGELIKDVKQSLLDQQSKIIATDCSKFAPALYFADKYYIVPRITEENYIPVLIEICKKEKIDVITTLIDPEISILAKNKNQFEAMGINVLAPQLKTAALCFDKYYMFQYLREKGIKTITTYENIKDFKIAYEKNDCQFPIFIKPRTGSGSVDAIKVNTYEELELMWDSTFIIQEFMNGVDVDADIYVDTISHKAVSVFLKKKLEKKLGGANKTLSFKDEKLVKFIEDIVNQFEFNGPIDMDFFYCHNDYYLSEINPRFGGGYLHAYGSGIDFIKLIINNTQGKENYSEFENYEEGIVMLMYDSSVIKKLEGVVL